MQIGLLVFAINQSQVAMRLTPLICTYLQDSWQELPYIFNGQKRIKYHHPLLWCWEDVAVVHYVDAKPWDFNNSEHTAFQVQLASLVHHP